VSVVGIKVCYVRDGLDFFSWEIVDFVIDFWSEDVIEAWTLPEK